MYKEAFVNEIKGSVAIQKKHKLLKLNELHMFNVSISNQIILFDLADWFSIFVLHLH